MTPILYALNAGRGDCFFLEIPNHHSAPSVVLIDGGEDYIHDQMKPVSIAKEFHWDKIDLLILTHLHHDHLVGLLEVAASMNIAEAVLPYPEFQVPDTPCDHPKARQTQELFQLYGQLCESLRLQGTTIRIRPPYGGLDVWQFGLAVIRHLDPVNHEDILGYRIIQQLQDDSLDSEVHKRLFIQFDRVSNRDSSVWVIESVQHPHEQWLLLGGDALKSNWTRLLNRETPHPNVFKVPHHGLKDALDEDLVKRLAPRSMIITNNEQEYRIYGDWWRSLASVANVSLLVMGVDPRTRFVRIELSEPVTMMKREVADEA